MSILTYPLGFIGGGKEFYNGVMENSLLFDNGSTPLLTRTPSSAGNRRTFTFSTWYKRTELATTNVLFSGYVDGNNFFAVRIRETGDDGKIEILNYSSGNDLRIHPSVLFRDTNAWYHMVVAVDTTQAKSTDRVDLYINGKIITNFSTETQPSHNFETDVNNTNAHYVGSNA